MIFRLSCLWILIFVMPSLLWAEAPDVVDARMLGDALKRSVGYLQRDGRAWFDGEIVVQEQGCVSCHQVPSGTWALRAAYDALQQDPPADFAVLLADATDFAADEEVGRPAMWSQLLIAAQSRSQSAQPTKLVDTYLPLILNSQQETGAWLAKGQFPYQRRPITESDAVVTMWMMHALRTSAAASELVETPMDLAREYVESTDGSTTEWLAWRWLLTDSAEGPPRRAQLVAQQQADGSWGWREGEPGNAYATGVALYALASRAIQIDEPLQRAARYLLDAQEDDGTWITESKLVSSEGTETHDYIYHYWSTAWATIGLAELLQDMVDR